MSYKEGYSDGIHKVCAVLRGMKAQAQKHHESTGDIQAGRCASLLVEVIREVQALEDGIIEKERKEIVQ